MRLIHERMDHYSCGLTKELDKLANIPEIVYRTFHHYIYFNGKHDNRDLLSIRVPGGTVGSIELDKDNCITEISIDTDYVIKTYEKDVEEKINNKFKGVKIEFS